MAVVVEVEHAGEQHAGFHREDMAVAAASHVEELFHAPLCRSLAVECAALGRARAAVNHVVIGDHHHFLRRGHAVDAERVEFALGAHHHAVVDHDEVGIGVDHVAGAHHCLAAFHGEGFFDCGHAHDL
ncbi:hypothetical protein D3C83_08600 [compost metagenome]